MKTIEDESLVQNERKLGLLLMATIGLFTLFDVVEDLLGGASLLHMLAEISIVLGCLTCALYLWRKVNATWKSKAVTIKQEANAAREDLVRFKNSSAAYIKGISEAIDNQLIEWGLSEAEREISFLLIKGLSFKEIAIVRNTSEHTVRQQAASVYRKSGLGGRAQLSAFFLEDLFEAPQELKASS